MEEINGVNFEDWAAAMAHIAQGMSEAEVCDILEIESPIWQDTNEKWMAKLGDLMAEDMNVATQYGDIFANPKVGRFATVTSSPTTSMEDLLQIVPDFDSYQKIFWQQSIASDHGIDSVTVLEQNGLDLQMWGQLNMHFMNWNNEFLNSNLSETNPQEYKQRFDEVNAIQNKWENHWTEFYKENKVDLSDDINF